MAAEDRSVAGAGGAPVAGEPRLDHVNLHLFEASPDGVMILARDGRLLFINASGRRALDRDDGENHRHLVWMDLWPEKNWPEVEAAFATACAEGSARFTARRPSSRGAPRWWDVVVSGIKGETGEVVGVLSISRDVTASHALSETLRRSQQQFQALANNMAQLAWMADPDGQIFWYNKRWFDYTGAKMETIAGDGWRSLHHPDHVTRVVDKYYRCIAASSVWEDLFPLRGADGGYHWFLSRAMPVRGLDGRIEFWCGTNTDVTEQRRQTQRLRTLARIIEMSHEAMLVRELGGSIVLWNRGCEELYGFDKSEALNTSIFDLLKPKNIAHCAEFDAEILANGAWSGEVLYTASDGTDAWVDSRQELFKVGDRRLILETSRDISERREADEIRNLLVGELNHRVKNTLAIVQSIAAQTVRTSPSPAQFMTSFNGRLQSLASAHNILSDVAWAGAPIDELIASQISALEADAARIRLEGESIQLPPQTALQFALIVHELATNAVQHGALSSPEGRLTVSWVATAGDPRLIEMTWREEGGPAVVSPTSRGFGLTLIERSGALPNMKTAIEFHREGVIARVVAEARADNKGSGLFNPGQKRTQGRRPVQRPQSTVVRRVLIMDRSLSRALLLEDMLDNAGFVAVGPVSSAAAAAAELDQNRVDLVAVDVDEIEAADISLLLKDLARRGVPSLALGTPSRLAAIPRGTFSFLIAKPIEEAALVLAAVEAALREIEAPRKG